MKADIKEISALEKRLTSPRRQHLTAALARVSFVLLLWFTWFLGKLLSMSIAAGLAIVVTLPVFCGLLLRRLFTGRSIFKPVDVYGQNGHLERLYYFNCRRYYLKNASLFLFVLNNRIDLTGLSIRRYDRAMLGAGDACLLTSKPGIFNLWYIRNATKIAHGGRYKIEMEYLHRKNPVGDILLILKSIPAALFRQDTDNFSGKINIFGIEFMNLRMFEAVDLVTAALRTKTRKTIFFVNPYCLNMLLDDPDYYQALQQADAIFPDGIGVNLACRILRTPLRENVNGTDMLPFLCQAAVREGLTIFLLGAKPGIAARMKNNLEKQYSGIKVIGEHHGYFKSGEETDQVISAINAASPDILLVAFGVPRQEKWLIEHGSRIQCHVAMAVGGLFDFYSGNIPRAPIWMRELGLEWVYRLWQEPRRMWQRYLVGNPLFVLRVIKWKMFAAQKRGDHAEQKQQ